MTDETPTALAPTHAALVPADLVVRRPPAEVLEEARDAARAVAEVIASNPHKVVLGGRQYLQFADWQVLGRFYGVCTRIVSTEYFELGDTCGFVARAVAVRADGMEISGAEASCATDEPKWANKPLFQLRSMAQTRAAAKSLRNVLSFVPILAGFADTPAEEVIDDGTRAVSRRSATRRTPPSSVRDAEAFISHEERQYLFRLSTLAGWSKAALKSYLARRGIEDTAHIRKSEFDELVRTLFTERPPTDDASRAAREPGEESK